MSAEHLIEQFLGSNPESRRRAGRELTSILRGMADREEYGAAAELLRRSVTPAMDYTVAFGFCRICGKIKPRTSSPQKLKLAILGSFTTDQLVMLADLFLFAAGISAEIYSADYGVFRQEILHPDSDLYQFKPEIVYLATSWRDIGHRPALGNDREAVANLVQAELSEWMTLWNAVHQRLGCQVICNNFDTPTWRQLGNHELRHAASLGRFISQLNAAFFEQAPPFVTIHDVDYLASSTGRWVWGDERFFHHAKLPCAPEHLVDYAHSVASIVIALRGLSKKCLVLDLDNTLWGGIIGDDGLGGIRLGQGEAVGEAYIGVQRYAKALKERGIILAVCSKNEAAIAKEVFQKHTEMVLREEDIACFVANWNDKAANLRAIAQQLEIGLNSLVFVDDNPAERAIVRQLVPEVAVPELPDDPAGYIEAIERYRYFQTVSIQAEDLKRADFYQANAQRQQAEAASANVEEYLESLEMVGRIEPVTSQTIERTAQLINRSNQFNLTTRRRTTAEVMALLKEPHWVTRTVSLVDRFGDNGLIGVILGRIEAESLDIDTWLMSCRVLKRGVEVFVLNHLVSLARSTGLKRLLGEYIPTAKNAMVKDHYASLGFKEIERDDNGRCRYELDVTDYQFPTCCIKEFTPNG
jgi:FkbH-like protein